MCDIMHKNLNKVDNIFKLLLIPIVTLSLYAQTPITPLPENAIYSVAKAELGKRLFFDPILSKDETISCSSCHNLPGNGANSTSFSIGVEGKEGVVNTPTVLNASLNFVQHYDGRAKTLKEQIVFPITDPLMLNTTVSEIVSKLSDTVYRTDFATVYPDGLTEDNFLDAITEFEKALITPNSKFDRYLRGDASALNKQERLGYEKFQSSGCINCHNGVNVGGNIYQKMGIFSPYTQKKVLNGRIDITERDRDKYVYKVPSLRNIELTAPYMHDGQVKTLKEAIKSMREHQLGVTNNSKSIEQIEAFLKTLTGETPAILKGMK